MNMSARKPVIDEHHDDKVITHKDNIVVYFERSYVKLGKCKPFYLQSDVIKILRIRWLVLS